MLLFLSVWRQKNQYFNFHAGGIQRKFARVRHDILAQCQINIRSRNITRVALLIPRVEKLREMDMKG